MTAEDIMVGSEALLNDTGEVIWDVDTLLPYVKRAYAELTLRLREYGVPVVREVSSVIEVDTAKTSITKTDITNLAAPIFLEERLNGTSDLFTPMTEKDWLPNEDKTDSLRYWVWMAGEIRLLGALTDREVRVKYVISPTPIATKDSVILIEGAQLFLETRTAAIAAGLAGGNFERASALAAEAESNFQSFLNSEVRSKQRFATRHRGYRR